MKGFFQSFSRILAPFNLSRRIYKLLHVQEDWSCCPRSITTHHFEHHQKYFLNIYFQLESIGEDNGIVAPYKLLNQSTLKIM